MTAEQTTKKRRPIGGIGLPPGAIIRIQDSTPTKALSPKTIPTDITHFEQFCRANFRGALQEYYQKFRPSVELRFETTKDEMENVFVSTSKVDEVVGVGRARTKKQAIQLASLDVIVRSCLASYEESKQQCDRNNFYGSKVIVPIFDNDQYKRDNFRGALLEYLQKQGNVVTPVFEMTSPPPRRFVSTCTFDGTIGIGEAGSKKKAIQLAAFDLICNLGLLPNEEIERQRERQKIQTEVRVFGSQLSQKALTPRVAPPIVMNEQYHKNNFRGVLQEYFQKLGVEDEFTFHTIVKSHKWFISTCAFHGIEGTGEANCKEDAIQLAALDLIVKLGLLSGEVERQLESKRDILRRGKGWKSGGLLYILPTAKAKLQVEKFATIGPKKTAFKCLLAVPISNLLSSGHESCKLFKCSTELCGIRKWMQENIPEEVLTDFADSELSGGLICSFFTKLSDKKLIAMLSSIRATHCALCGVETSQQRTLPKRLYSNLDLAFTGWGKREEQDKEALETARRETLEESGIDIEKVSWTIKLRRIFYGEPLYIFIDIEKVFPDWQNPISSRYL